MAYAYYGNDHTWYAQEREGYIKGYTQAQNDLLKAAEAVNPGKWLSEQTIQREHGEQEYVMLYEIDVPKLLEKHAALCAAKADLKYKSHFESISNSLQSYKGWLDDANMKLTAFQAECQQLREALTESTSMLCVCENYKEGGIVCNQVKVNEQLLNQHNKKEG